MDDDVELIFEEEKTPAALDPCPECGDELVRVKDDVPVPSGDVDAIWASHPRCEATRSRIWSWCARSGWLKQCFDRRGEPRTRFDPRRR